MHRQVGSSLLAPPGQSSGLMVPCCAVLSQSVVSNSLRPPGLQPARLLCPWDSPGKSTVVGCDFLLQGIFPTQGSNPYLLHFSRFFTVWATREAPYGITNKSVTKLPKVQCEPRSPGDLAKVQILFWSEAWDSAFISSSQGAQSDWPTNHTLNGKELRYISHASFNTYVILLGRPWASQVVGSILFRCSRK